MIPCIGSNCEEIAAGRARPVSVSRSPSSTAHQTVSVPYVGDIDTVTLGIAGLGLLAALVFFSDNVGLTSAERRAAEGFTTVSRDRFLAECLSADSGVGDDGNQQACMVKCNKLWGELSK